MYSQQIQSNLSGLTGPIGVRVSLNADRVHLEHVLEFVMVETNSAQAKKNKLNPVRTFHHAMLTNTNVLLIVKDRVQRTADISPLWHSDNPNKERNGDQLFSNIEQTVVFHWINLIV